MIDLIIYFFKKISDQINLNNTINNSLQNVKPTNHYALTKIDDGITVENFTLTLLQQKLIELERTLFSNMINEKTITKGKSFTKYHNSCQPGGYDLEDMNSLSEKINYITHDNKILKSVIF